MIDARHFTNSSNSSNFLALEVSGREDCFIMPLDAGGGQIGFLRVIVYGRYDVEVSPFVIGCQLFAAGPAPAPGGGSSWKLRW